MAYPSEPMENLQEMALSEHLTCINMTWQDEEPLNSEELAMLRRFGDVRK